MRVFPVLLYTIYLNNTMITSRREIRILLVQTLFENDFHKKSPDADSLVRVFNRLARDSNPELENNTFARKVLEGIASKYEEINTIIEHAAPNWPLDKIGSVDRNILRLGVFELLFGRELDVPGRVALNEAVEVTKVFLNTSARKFINGVLGSIYLEVKDPNEQDTAPKRIQVKKSVGGVVFRVDENDNLQFAFVHDIFGRWTLSKGGLEENEGDDGGFVRIIKDEIGVDVSVLGTIGTNAYIAHPPEGTVRKEVSYMLGRTRDPVLRLKETGGLDDAKWFGYEDAKKLQVYPDLRQIILDGMHKAMEFSKK